MTRPVYLDNAATTPVRPEVRDAMLPYLSEEAFGNPSSAHQFGRTARAGIDRAKRQIAAALDAEPNQVIFTSGGTEADNLAVVGGALAARTQGGGGRSASPSARSSTRRSWRRRRRWSGSGVKRSSYRWTHVAKSNCRPSTTRSREVSPSSAPCGSTTKSA